MKLQDIEQEALGLTERERADLVLSLMDTLTASEAEASDEEVARRDAELETGAVEPMPHEEFVRRVREERERAASELWDHPQIRPPKQIVTTQCFDFH